MSDNGIGCARDPAEDAGPVPWESKVAAREKQLTELRERHNNLALDYAKKEQELAAAEKRVAELQERIALLGEWITM